MKVLILSVSAGGGHSHAADALKSYIKLNDSKSEVLVIDTLKYINPIIDKLVVGSYLKTIKITPSLFGKLYDYSESDDGLTNIISSNFNKIMTYKLIPLINKFNPNVIVCTHPFPAEMVSIIKDKNNICIPSITILTDYAPHSLWLYKNTDAYIVSNSDMIREMELRGVRKNKIFDYGIPVKPSFFKEFNKFDTLKELGFSEKLPTFLIMGGSLGIGKIVDLYEELTKINNEIQIIIITGNNSKLNYKLHKLKEVSNKPTKIIGYTNNVNKYMQCCDLLLTKPGGLTITEALICKVPMAVFSPIPGQEEKNADFLFKHNLAINIDCIENTKQIIESLLNDKEKLQIMKKNCTLFSRPNSGINIYNLLNMLKKNKKIKMTQNNLNKSSKYKSFFKLLENYFIKTAEKFLL